MSPLPLKKQAVLRLWVKPQYKNSSTSECDTLMTKTTKRDDLQPMTQYAHLIKKPRRPYPP